MQSMVGSIEVATETVRRLASTLRPPALDHLGLGAAIELEAAAIARRTGVRCRIAGSVGDDALTSEQTTAVFRIVQEALTNVVRHANASAVKISMRQTTRSTSLTDRRQRPRHQPEGRRRSGLDRPARDARACAVDRREAVDQRHGPARAPRWSSRFRQARREDASKRDGAHSTGRRSPRRPTRHPANSGGRAEVGQRRRSQRRGERVGEHPRRGVGRRRPRRHAAGRERPRSAQGDPRRCGRRCRCWC